MRLIRSTSDRPNIFDLSENQRGKLPERDDKMVKSESCGLGLGRLTSATGSGRPHTAGGRPQTAVDAMKNTNGEWGLYWFGGGVALLHGLESSSLTSPPCCDKFVPFPAIHCDHEDQGLFHYSTRPGAMTLLITRHIHS